MRFSVYKMLIFFLIIVTIMLGLILYPFLPDTLLVFLHFETQVTVSKFIAIFFIPLLMFIFFLYICIFSSVCVTRKIQGTFKKRVYVFWTMIFVLLLYTQSVFLIGNIWYDLDMLLLWIIAFSLVLFFVGFYIQKSSHNVVLDMCVTWIVKEDEDSVWNHVHRILGVLLQISAILLLFSLGIPFLISPFLMLFAISVGIGGLTTMMSYIQLISNR